MNKACAFTGHRPSKLPGGYNWYNQKNIELGKQIRKVVSYLIEIHNVDTFISGGAIGVDQMAFFIVDKLKKQKYSNIENILAIPFKFQYKKWQDKDINKYMESKTLADKIIYVDELNGYTINGLESKIYHPAKMQKRNEYMIDNTNCLISVWNKGKGGTYNCIKYCLYNYPDKIIINVNPSTLNISYLANERND